MSLNPRKGLIHTFLHSREDLGEVSISEKMFEDVLSLHRNGIKLSNPSLQEFEDAKKLQCKLNIIKIKVSDPQNNDILDDLCSEAASTQEMMDELNACIAKKKSDIQNTKNALSKAKRVCEHWKSLRYWHEVPKWQRLVNAASSLLMGLSHRNDEENNCESEGIGDAARSELQRNNELLTVDEECDGINAIATSVRVPTSNCDQQNVVMIDTVDGDAKELNSVFTEAEKDKPNRKRKSTVSEEHDEPKRSKKYRLCTENEFIVHLRKRIGPEKRAIDNDSLVWLHGGMIQCSACKTMLKELRSCHRHRALSGHHENLQKWKENKLTQRTIREGMKGCNEATSNTCLVTTKHRISALRAIASANMPLSALESLAPWIDSISKPGLTLGGVKEIPRNYAAILHSQLRTEMKCMLKHSFLEFGITFDGTPSFAVAEAIKIRFVTYKFDIVELLVKVSCFKKKLNAENIANHLIQTITGDLGLHVKNWVTSQQDRASTNLCALRKIRDTVADANPTRNDCVSHTLSNAGKAMLLSDNAKHANLFRKQWQSVIQYPGRARDLAKEVMEETVKESGGVRFFKKQEQVNQISSHTPSRILHDIVAECVNGKFSEASSKLMMSTFGGVQKKGELSMATLESAAMVDIGRKLCAGCYSAEGDSPLILTIRMIFDGLERYLLAFDNEDNELVDTVLEDCIRLLEEAMAPLVEDCDNANNNVDRVRDEFNAAEASLTALEERHREITHTGGQNGGRQRRRNPAFIDNELLQEVNIEINDAKEEVSEKKKNLDDATKEADDKRKALDEWKQKFPNQNRDELIEHAKLVCEPAITYYKQQFIEEGGDLYKLRKRGMACALFDPLFLKGKEEEIGRLELLADELKNFEYRHFTDEFIQELKKEIPLAVEHANSEFDWDTIPATQQFKTRIDRKIKRRNLPDDENVDWKDDPGERACRIWEWWKMRVMDCDRFKYFKVALRLVVLTQVSSCSVERVFSQLKLMRDACGDNMFEDMVEIRMFCMCNGDLGV